MGCLFPALCYGMRSLERDSWGGLSAPFSKVLLISSSDGADEHWREGKKGTPCRAGEGQGEPGPSPRILVQGAQESPSEAFQGGAGFPLQAQLQGLQGGLHALGSLRGILPRAPAWGSLARLPLGGHLVRARWADFSPLPFRLLGLCLQTPGLLSWGSRLGSLSLRTPCLLQGDLLQEGGWRDGQF